VRYSGSFSASGRGKADSASVVAQQGRKKVRFNAGEKKEVEADALARRWGVKEKEEVIDAAKGEGEKKDLLFQEGAGPTPFLHESGDVACRNPAAGKVSPAAPQEERGKCGRTCIHFRRGSAIDHHRQRRRGRKGGSSISVIKKNHSPNPR